MATNPDTTPDKTTELSDSAALAATIHVPGREVAKTVLLRADSGYAYVVAVLPADRAVDFERASQILGGSKLGLATEVEIARHCPDCVPGGRPGPAARQDRPACHPGPVLDLYVDTDSEPSCAPPH